MFRDTEVRVLPPHRAREMLPLVERDAIGLPLVVRDAAAARSLMGTPPARPLRPTNNGEDFNDQTDNYGAR